MDEGGQVIMDLEHDVYKVRLDADGNQIDRAKAEGTIQQVYCT